MHILVVNDDGPPSNSSSPYVHSLVSTLQSAGHKVSVILPNVQRSWIGKAHIVGQTLTPTYFRPGTLLKDDGIESDRPSNDDNEEWVLLNGTPASCVQIGLHHIFNDGEPIDLVVSGPNYGRNTTAVFALSSGTLGGALEASVNGKKAIALSYAFDSREHDLEIISEASQLSVKLIEKFYNEWADDVHVYSINVPVQKGVSNTKIVYTHMLQNQWTSGSSFEELAEGSTDADPNTEEQRIRENGISDSKPDAVQQRRKHCTYRWAPQFGDVRKAVQESGQGDGWEVIQGHVSVTPLRANFWHLPQYKGEIKLDSTCTSLYRGPRIIYAMVDYHDEYVQPIIVRALVTQLVFAIKFVKSVEQLPDPSSLLLQFSAYESINFDNAMENSASSLICAYVIRKALIRKHYLSHTVETWLAKHPNSTMKHHFKICTHFELDFAEFLDEALVDAWDLNESMAKNAEASSEADREWWILKPGMSDGGNGIRLFSTMAELQAIFDNWEEAINSDDEDLQEHENSNDRDTTDQPGTMTSQLRHFIAQPYIANPLLLDGHSQKKFHLRVYVVAVGALKVYVSREMLALFAAKSYRTPSSTALDDDLSRHLTNTCFQDEATRVTSVHRFWDMEHEIAPDWQETVFDQICETVGEVFEAAAKEQMVHFQTLPNAFEVFGADFLVDESLNAWLLEFNAYPDFKQTGQGLQDVVIKKLFQELVHVVIIPYFDGRAAHTSSEPSILRLVKDIDLGRR